MQHAYLFCDPPRAGLPAENMDFTVNVEGCDLYGQVLLAAGDAPHPTALLLHGFPGHEKNLDLAQALRRTGVNAAFFSYRGCWGSQGTYAIAQLVADTRAVLSHLRENAATYRANGDIWLIGHSLGGFTALHTLCEEAHIKGAALLTPCDLGMLYQTQPAQFGALIDPEDTGNGCLRTPYPGALREALAAHAADWAFASIADKLPHIPMLFVGGTQDAVTPPNEHIAPLLQRLGGRAAYREIDDGHGFFGSRTALIQTVGEWLAQYEG